MKAVMTSVGRGLPGRANARLARGRGRFVDDLRPHGTCHVAIVRSPHANALVLGVDLKRALALPGVVAAVDGEEIRRRTNPIPEGWDTSVIEARRVDWYALAAERVRYVGEAVAAVVAADRPTAVAAAELVEVDYQPLPAVTDAHQALRPGAPLVEPAWGDNLLLTQEFAAGDVEDAMTRAFQVVSGQVSSQRITGVPIEPRGILASYDRNQGRLTFWESTQQPHQVRSYLAQALGMPEAGIRVIQPHVGGAFGLKQPTSQEEVLLAFLAVRLGRPLKWIEERSESLAAGGHARETSCRYQAAVGPDGLVTAMRVDGVPRLGHVAGHDAVRPDRLPGSRHQRAAALGGHQQVPVDSLPGLRQGRGHAADGARHGPRGRPARRRPCGPAPAPPDRPGRVPLPAALRRRARQRRLPAGAAPRGGARRRRQPSGDALQRPRARAPPRARHRHGADPRGRGRARVAHEQRLRRRDRPHLADRRGHRAGRRDQPGDRQRDRPGPDRRRRAGLRGRAGARRPGRHRRLPLGARQLQLAEHHHRRLGGRAGRRRPAGQAGGGGRQHARRRGGRGGRRARALLGPLATRTGGRLARGRPGGLLARVRGPRRGGRPGAGGHPLLPDRQRRPPAGPRRAPQHVPDLGQRRGRLPRRGRRGHRRGRVGRLPRGGGRRQDREPAAGRGQPARRHRPGGRRRALRAARLRRRRAVPDRHPDGLHHPDRRGAAPTGRRAPADAVAVHAAGHQGGRRVRHGRDPGGDLRGGRERLPGAGAAARRAAADPGPGLERHPGSGASEGGSDVPDGYIGQRHPGLRNRPLTQGRGTYVADIELDGMLHMAVLRSPHASARIVSVDTTAALALPGVRYVVTGAEIRRHTRPIPEGWDTSTINARGVVWYALCVDRVRYVGEAVAAVVATDRFQAERALAEIEVVYEVEAARLAADGVVEGSLRVHRTTGVPIEPRGIVASWDEDAELLTFWDSTQNPHPLRLYLSQTIGLAESKIRVIQPQVGGAFGLKQPTFQEEPLIAYLALRLGRPIRWIEQRDENFLCTGHARDMRVGYRASYLEDGTVTGLELEILADVGAPTSLVGWGMSISASGIVPGPYRIPNTLVRLRSVVTNKGHWNSYRGFGRDAANWWLERVLDEVAGKLGLDRAAVRFRNFIGPDEFPFSREGGGIIDSGDYPASLRHALDLIGYQDFERERGRARAQGRFIGIGIGNELGSEGCAMPGSAMISAFDGATVRMSPSGEVTVLSGVTSPGSGNETGLAQIVADTVGCELERVTVVQGDTEVCPWGLGNYSSRSIIIGGSAAELAAVDLRDKLLTVAGNMLEASTEDLEIARGRVAVRGAPRRSVSLAEVAMEIYTRPYGPNAGGVEPGLEATRYFRAPNIYHQPATQGRFNAYPTWPSATAACVVEVDPETGMVRILRHCLVDDSGTVVNPTLVEANLHGATAQAIGGGLFEQIAYDDAGQLQTATLMDYTIPTAVELPMITVEHEHSPSPFTPLGTKGAGESGMGSALGALTSAIEDALPHLPLRLTELPLTPSRVWQAIQRARAQASTPALT